MQNSQTFDSRTILHTSKRSLDLLVLKYMRKRVRLTLRHLEPCSESQHPIIYNFHERHGRTHRIVLYQCQELMQRPGLMFVGFISRRQEQLDASIIHAIHSVDQELVAEMAENAGILCYSSLELRTGIWFNLVVMANSDAKRQVLDTPTHTYAAYQLAPSYYKWIRLHTGTMSRGLFQDDMEIERTRSYTFHTAHARPAIQEYCYVDTTDNTACHAED